MTDDLRNLWTREVTADDYEAHMAAVGQAQANASLLAAFLGAHRPAARATACVVGAGTGQMFDYAPPSLFDAWETTFTDLNATFLGRLRRRLGGTSRSPLRLVVDDVERSSLKGPFDVVVAVLVLEHVRWRIGAATLARLARGHLFVILQENPPTLSQVVTPTRAPIGTMRAFRTASPTLVPRSDLEQLLRELGFEPGWDGAAEVADGKRMVGVAFHRVGSDSRRPGAFP
jgi:hypothetical protein